MQRMSNITTSIIAKIPVRQQPQTGNFILKGSYPQSGGRVLGNYAPSQGQQVTFEDDPKAFQVRNPQLKETEWQDWLSQMLVEELHRKR